MKKQRKRVTLSLPDDLVRLLDHSATVLKETRSALAEEWLRYAALREQQRTLEAELSDYYRGVSVRERAEDASIVEGWRSKAKQLNFDEPSTRRRR